MKADLVLYLAAACGVLSALMGSRMALALMASLVASEVMNAAGVPAPWWRLVALDLAVIAVVWRPLWPPNFTTADKLILGLFPVAWFFYAMPDPERYWGCFGVVVVQLFLTMPLTRLQGSLGSFTHGPRRLAHHGGG